MKKYALIPFLFVVVACSTIKVTYDYDRETDFSKFKTYSFSEETMNLGIDQLNRDRILKAVEIELAAKGFSKSDNPDAIVDVYIKGQKIQTATATTTGYGGRYRYGYGGGFSTTQIDYNTYTEGTMFIILVDKSTQKVVWQGTGVKTIDENASPEKREKNINYSVNQIMMNYPPKRK